MKYVISVLVVLKNTFIQDNLFKEKMQVILVCKQQFISFLYFDFPY